MPKAPWWGGRCTAALAQMCTLPGDAAPQYRQPSLPRNMTPVEETWDKAGRRNDGSNNVDVSVAIPVSSHGDGAVRYQYPTDGARATCRGRVGPVRKTVPMLLECTTKVVRVF